MDFRDIVAIDALLSLTLDKDEIFLINHQPQPVSYITFWVHEPYQLDGSLPVSHGRK